MAQIDAGGVCMLGRAGDVCLDDTHYKRIIEKSNSSEAKPSRETKPFEETKIVEAGEVKPRASAIAELAREAIGCDDDVCVLEHPTAARALGEHKVEQLKKERLKVVGPANSTRLLDNFNIDHNVWQWMRVHPEFQGCGFAMIDFMAHPLPLMGDFPGLIRLSEYDPVRAYKEGKTCAGCVINSDRHSGGGVHWMALFVDMRGSSGSIWTVSFFNSSGRAPVSEIVRWQRAMCERMAPLAASHGTTAEDIAVSQVEHQMGNTECGPYSLYYIWSRLQGVPDAEFRKHRIPDEKMEKFRKSLFRTEK